METCFNYCYERGNNDGVGWFSSDELRFINRVHELAEQHPDEVTIIKEPEENFGCIYCKVPQTWLKIIPPRSLNLTDEQRAAMRERAKNNFNLDLTT